MKLAEDGQRRIGATDAAPIVAFYRPEMAHLAKWSSAADVYFRLVHGVSKPRTKPMARGIAAEPQLRAIYASTIGQPLPAKHPIVCRHEAHPWATSSPDDVAEAEGGGLVVIEYKSTSVYARKSWGEPLTDLIPDSYLCQVAWNCEVVDAPFWHLLVGFGVDSDEGFGFLESVPYQGERDRELGALLLECGERFQRDFIDRRMPPPVAPVANKRVISRLLKEEYR